MDFIRVCLYLIVVVWGGVILWLWALPDAWPVKIRLVFLGTYGLGALSSFAHRWVQRGETARRKGKNWRSGY